MRRRRLRATFICLLWSAGTTPSFAAPGSHFPRPSSPSFPTFPIDTASAGPPPPTPPALGSPAAGLDPTRLTSGRGFPPLGHFPLLEATPSQLRDLGQLSDLDTEDGPLNRKIVAQLATIPGGDSALFQALHEYASSPSFPPSDFRHAAALALWRIAKRLFTPLAGKPGYLRPVHQLSNEQCVSVATDLLDFFLHATPYTKSQLAAVTDSISAFRRTAFRHPDRQDGCFLYALVANVMLPQVSSHSRVTRSLTGHLQKAMQLLIGNVRTRLPTLSYAFLGSTLLRSRAVLQRARGAGRRVRQWFNRLPYGARLVSRFTATGVVAAAAAGLAAAPHPVTCTDPSCCTGPDCPIPPPLPDCHNVNCSRSPFFLCCPEAEGANGQIVSLLRNRGLLNGNRHTYPIFDDQGRFINRIPPYASEPHLATPTPTSADAITVLSPVRDRRAATAVVDPWPHFLVEAWPNLYHVIEGAHHAPRPRCRRTPVTICVGGINSSGRPAHVHKRQAEDGPGLCSIDCLAARELLRSRTLSRRPTTSSEPHLSQPANQLASWFERLTSPLTYMVAPLNWLASRFSLVGVSATPASAPVRVPLSWVLAKLPHTPVGPTSARTPRAFPDGDRPHDTRSLEEERNLVLHHMRSAAGNDSTIERRRDMRFISRLYLIAASWQPDFNSSVDRQRLQDLKALWSEEADRRGFSLDDALADSDAFRLLIQLAADWRASATQPPVHSKRSVPQQSPPLPPADFRHLYSRLALSSSLSHVVYQALPSLFRQPVLVPTAQTLAPAVHANDSAPHPHRAERAAEPLLHTAHWLPIMLSRWRDSLAAEQQTTTPPPSPEVLVDPAWVKLTQLQAETAVNRTAPATSRAERAAPSEPFDDRHIQFLRELIAAELDRANRTSRAAEPTLGGPAYLAVLLSHRLTDALGLTRSTGSSTDPAPLVNHMGLACESECAGVLGYCPFCGIDGLCCRTGYERRGCDGLLGRPDTAICVPAAHARHDDPPPRELNMGLACESECAGLLGYCPFCGFAGMCCQAGVKRRGCDGLLGEPDKAVCVPEVRAPHDKPPPLGRVRRFAALPTLAAIGASLAKIGSIAMMKSTVLASATGAKIVAASSSAAAAAPAAAKTAATFVAKTAAGAGVIIGGSYAIQRAIEAGDVPHNDSVVGANLGTECLPDCGYTGGYCKFCGAEGMCCQQGYNRRGCDGAMGVSTKFLCVFPGTSTLENARRLIVDSLLFEEDANATVAAENRERHRHFLFELISAEATRANVSPADAFPHHVLDAYRPRREAPESVPQLYFSGIVAQAPLVSLTPPSPTLSSATLREFNLSSTALDYPEQRSDADLVASALSSPINVTLSQFGSIMTSMVKHFAINHILSRPTRSAPLPGSVPDPRLAQLHRRVMDRIKSLERSCNPGFPQLYRNHLPVLLYICQVPNPDLRPDAIPMFQLEPPRAKRHTAEPPELHILSDHYRLHVLLRLLAVDDLPEVFYILLENVIVNGTISDAEFYVTDSHYRLTSLLSVLQGSPSATQSPYAAAAKQLVRTLRSRHILQTQCGLQPQPVAGSVSTCELKHAYIADFLSAHMMRRLLPSSAAPTASTERPLIRRRRQATPGPDPGPPPSPTPRRRIRFRRLHGQAHNGLRHPTVDENNNVVYGRNGAPNVMPYCQDVARRDSFRGQLLSLAILNCLTDNDQPTTVLYYLAVQANLLELYDRIRLQWIPNPRPPQPTPLPPSRLPGYMAGVRMEQAHGRDVLPYCEDVARRDEFPTQLLVLGVFRCLTNANEATTLLYYLAVQANLLEMYDRNRLQWVPRPHPRERREATPVATTPLPASSTGRISSRTSDVSFREVLIQLREQSAASGCGFISCASSAASAPRPWISLSTVHGAAALLSSTLRRWGSWLTFPSAEALHSTRPHFVVLSSLLGISSSPDPSVITPISSAPGGRPHRAAPDLRPPARPTFERHSTPHFIAVSVGDAAVDVQLAEFVITMDTSAIDGALHAAVQQTSHRVNYMWSDPRPRPHAWRHENPDIHRDNIRYLVRRDRALDLTLQWNNLKRAAVRDYDSIVPRPTNSSMYSRYRRSIHNSTDAVISASLALTPEEWTLLLSRLIHTSKDGFQVLCFDNAAQTVALPVGNLSIGLRRFLPRTRRNAMANLPKVGMNVLWAFVLSFLSKEQAQQRHNYQLQLQQAASDSSSILSTQPHSDMAHLARNLQLLLLAQQRRVVKENWDADALMDSHLDQTEDAIRSAAQFAASGSSGRIHPDHLHEIPWNQVKATYDKERQNGYTPLVESPFQHLTVQTTVAALSRNQDLLGFQLILYSPLVHHTGLMTAYRTIPAPVEVNPGDFIIFAPPQQRIILVAHRIDPSSGLHPWVALSSTEFSRCHRTGTFYSCRDVGVIRPPIPDQHWGHLDSSVCAYALYARRPKLAASACARTEIQEDVHCIRVGPYSWSVFSRHEVIPHITCDTLADFDPTVQTPILGVGILSLPPGCKANLAGWSLFADRSNNAATSQTVFPNEVFSLREALSDSQQQSHHDVSRYVSQLQQHGDLFSDSYDIDSETIRREFLIAKETQRSAATHLTNIHWTTPVLVTLLVLSLLLLGLLAFCYRDFQFKIFGAHRTLATLFASGPNSPGRVRVIIRTLDERLLYLEAQCRNLTLALFNHGIPYNQARLPANLPVPSLPHLPGIQLVHHQHSDDADDPPEDAPLQRLSWPEESPSRRRHRSASYTIRQASRRRPFPPADDANHVESSH